MICNQNKRSAQEPDIILHWTPIAAAIAMALFAGGPAFAVNECGIDPDANGTAADVIECATGARPDGITHISNGDLMVRMVGTTSSNLGAGGLSTTAGGVDDDLTIITSAAVSSTTAQAAIHAQSENGNINVTTGGNVSGTASSIQYGILARAASAGDIAITTGGLTSVGTGAANPGVAAILAESGGGDISMIVQGVTHPGNTIINGREYGIQAHTTGAGAITIDSLMGGIVNSNAAGIAALEATTGTGDISVSIRNGSLNSGSRAGAVGILTQTQGMTTINVVDARLAAGSSSLNDVSSRLLVALRASGGDLTLSTSRSLAEQLSDEQLLASTGALGIRGGLDLTGLTGTSAITIGKNTTWELTADSQLGDGDTLLVLEEGSILYAKYLTSGPQSARGAEGVFVMNFGGGSDLVVNRGKLMLGSDGRVEEFGGETLDPERIELDLRLQGLDTFENRGEIYLGARMGALFSADNQKIVGSDGGYDDRLEMQGTHFIGGEGSRIYLDANLNNVGQSRCAAEDRDLTTGNLQVNDCVDIRNGSASGRTELIVKDVLFGDRGAYNPEGNVVIDLSGGTGAVDPEAFVLSAASDSYDPASRLIDKGLFVYAIGYDEDLRQFKLYGVESPASQQFAFYGAAANELWRTSVSTWFERQLAQRNEGLAPGAGGGVWLRGSAVSGDREIGSTLAFGSSTLQYDNSFTQNSSTVTFGLDLGARGDGYTAWGIGAMFGYARARIGFDATPNRGNFEGVHGGVYGSYTSGGLFVDAALNWAWLSLDNDIGNLDLGDEVLSTDVTSAGGQAEAGYRFQSGRIGLEPLVSLSYVKSRFEHMNVPARDPARFGGRIRFDNDPESLRTGLGLRLSVRDLVPTLAPIDASLTAKAINESEGQSIVTVLNVGPEAPQVSDAFDGAFTQLSGALTVSDSSRRATGYLNLSTQLGDDYSSLGFSAGFRYQW